MSASQVARLTGVSHQLPTQSIFYFYNIPKKYKFKCEEWQYVQEHLLQWPCHTTDLSRGVGARNQACNPSYSEAKIWRIEDQGQPGQKVHETPISTNGWTRWHASVIPAQITLGSTNRRILV
jgi:hypothetical protein